MHPARSCHTAGGSERWGREEGKEGEKEGGKEGEREGRDRDESLFY